MEGIVRDVQTRTEYGGKDAASQFVLNFRVEEYDDALARVRLVPIEMKGIIFEGTVSNGDRVRASGRMRSGTLRVKRLHNLTTGADVSARSYSKIGCAIFLIFAIGMVVFFLVMSRAQPPGHP
ncbi:hypothetical protein ACPCTK_22705 [Streptomyces pseudogriseolus]|uniref:hypothetical protein n=1 Tax=Streptomyces pseudogriseolus TaxID=36817 RepID=UPI003FA1E118